MGLEIINFIWLEPIAKYFIKSIENNKNNQQIITKKINNYQEVTITITNRDNNQITNKDNNQITNRINIKLNRSIKLNNGFKGLVESILNTNIIYKNKSKEFYVEISNDTIIVYSLTNKKPLYRGMWYEWSSFFGYYQLTEKYQYYPNGYKFQNNISTNIQWLDDFYQFEITKIIDK